MTDISITAANVLSAAGTPRKAVVAGATVTAGQAVVRDSSTGRYVLADNNHATAALRVPDGIALNGAANGQPLTIHLQGEITIGATLTPGTTYYLSDTAGGICPLSDVGDGERAVVIGIAKSASVLDVQILDSGVNLSV